MLITIFLTLSMVLSACDSQAAFCAYVSDNSGPVSHALWDSLLSKHVDDEGNVDYKGFTDNMELLDTYLGILSSNHPDESGWSVNERLAYWINAYNAFTVKLVAEHYPVESIKDIRRGIPMVNSVWDIKFIEIGGRKYDLNNIEHQILRKEFDEPRIHFAINCASVSCPDLRNEAYTAERIEMQLQEQTTRFLTDESKNRLGPDEVELSKIFSWFRRDFTNDGSLIDFLNRHGPVSVSRDARISYMEYDWGLNE